MLTMAFILAVLSAWVEVKFVRRIGFIHHIMTKGLLGIDAGLCNLVLSIAISLFLGSMFGVGGLIAFLGGLGSTAVTNVYYPNEDRVAIVSGYAKRAPAMAASGLQKSQAVYNDVKQPLTDLGHLTMSVVKVIVFPFTALRWASVQYTAFRNNRNTA